MIKLDREKLELVHSVLNCVLDGVQVDNEYLIACKDYIKSITPPIPKYKVGDLVFWKDWMSSSLIHEAIIVRVPKDDTPLYTIALMKYPEIKYVSEERLFITYKDAAKEGK